MKSKSIGRLLKLMSAALLQGCITGNDDRAVAPPPSLVGAWTGSGKEYLYYTSHCTIYYNPYREVCTGENVYADVAKLWTFNADNTYSFSSQDGSDTVYVDWGSWTQSGNRLELVLSDCRSASYSITTYSWSPPRSISCQGQKEAFDLRYGADRFHIVALDSASGQWDTTATYVRL